MKEALKRLITALDQISKDHDEVGDTVVRTVMRNVITASFILPQPEFVIPTHFGMFSDSGNQKVGKAIQDFLSHPGVRAALSSLTPEMRLAAFEDSGVKSEIGSTYDSYFGHKGRLVYHHGRSSSRVAPTGPAIYDRSVCVIARTEAWCRDSPCPQTQARQRGDFAYQPSTHASLISFFKKAPQRGSMMVAPGKDGSFKLKALTVRCPGKQT